MTDKLIGIDIGTITTGIAIYTINGFRIVNIETFLINTILTTGKGKTYDMPYKLNRIRQSFSRLLDYSIFGISIENPFMYDSRPGAVIPLGKVIGVLEETAISYNPNIHLRRISPSEVKKSVTVHGNSADKNDMTKAVGKIKEITKFINPIDISEHEVDALAIGYELLNYYRENPYNFI